MKQLYRVLIEGEIFVMAENEGEARRGARRAIDDESESLVQQAAPIMDIPVAVMKYIDKESLQSFPWNADDDDHRTVADHIKALGVDL